MSQGHLPAAHTLLGWELLVGFRGPRLGQDQYDS